MTKPPKSHVNTYLLRLLHPQLTPIIPGLLKEWSLLFLAQRPPFLNYLLIPIRPIGELRFPFWVVHVGIKHGRNGSAITQTFVGPHFFRRTLVVSRGDANIGTVDVGVLVHVYPGTGRFRKRRAELGATKG